MAQPPPASHWPLRSLNRSSHNGMTPEPRAAPGVSRRSPKKLTYNKLLGKLNDSLSTFAKSRWDVPIRKLCKPLSIWDPCIQTLNSSTCSCWLSVKSCHSQRPSYTSYVQIELRDTRPRIDVRLLCGPCPDHQKDRKGSKPYDFIEAWHSDLAIVPRRRALRTHFTLCDVTPQCVRSLHNHVPACTP
jgi:hypothetical protein